MRGDHTAALESFERALSWCGGTEAANHVVIEEEWKAVWENYVQTRDAVLNKVPP